MYVPEQKRLFFCDDLGKIHGMGKFWYISTESFPNSPKTGEEQVWRLMVTPFQKAIFAVETAVTWSDKDIPGQQLRSGPLPFTILEMEWSGENEPQSSTPHEPSSLCI